MFGVLRPYLPWVAISILSIALIFTNRNPQVQALRSDITDFAEFAFQPIYKLHEAVRLWDENRRLREIAARMSLRSAQLEEGLRENIRLREMLNFARNSPYRLIAAEVIGVAPDPAVRGLLIDRGSDDGVEVNMAAVTVQGGVGRVYRVGGSTAAVQLLVDPHLGVAGRLAEIRENGIVHSTGRGWLRLDGVPVSAEVAAGDVVITSGQGGIFPQGLKIGTVKTVKPADGGWLWEITLDAAVDFNRLEEVFIIRDRPPDG